MKQKNEYTLIDQKFLIAVDEVIKKNKVLGIKPENDSQIGSAIYPSNRSIIAAVRIKQKHIPHLALINFAKAFGVDMNYFYYENYSFKFNNPSPLSERERNHLYQKDTDILKEVKSLRKNYLNSKKVYKEVTYTTDKIDDFANRLDHETAVAFYKLLSSIKTEYQNRSSLLEQMLFDKSMETESYFKTLTNQIHELQKELIIAKDTAFSAQQNEKRVHEMYAKN